MLRYIDTVLALLKNSFSVIGQGNVWFININNNVYMLISLIIIYSYWFYITFDDTILDCLDISSVVRPLIFSTRVFLTYLILALGMDILTSLLSGMFVSLVSTFYDHILPCFDYVININITHSSHLYDDLYHYIVYLFSLMDSQCRDI